MEKLRSVCIIQRIDQQVPAVYLKEFFMFAGAFLNCTEMDTIYSIKQIYLHLLYIV